jgi:hypothetical protein
MKEVVELEEKPDTDDSNNEPVTKPSIVESEINKDEAEEGSSSSTAKSVTTEESVSSSTDESSDTDGTTFEPPPLVQYLEPMADEECQDLNSEFCTYIGSRPEYCDKRYYLNNKTVLEICKRTCKACNTTFSTFMGIKPPVRKPVPLRPNGQECRDYNGEFCRYVAKKPSLCKDDTTIGDNQRISEICKFAFTFTVLLILGFFHANSKKKHV